MRTVSLFIVSLLIAVQAHAWSGTLSGAVTCADADNGTWVTTYTGNASISVSGTFNSGTTHLYHLLTNGAGQVIPNTAATDGTTSPYPVTLAAGDKLCVQTSAATAIHWEINPDMVKFPGSGELVPRFFIPEADYAAGVGQSG